MTFSSPIRLCACGCGVDISDRRPQARYHSKACWLRAHHRRQRAAHPHPYRDTPQYKQMRDEWPEYVGYSWVSAAREDIDLDYTGRAGDGERRLGACWGRLVA